MGAGESQIDLSLSQTQRLVYEADQITLAHSVATESLQIATIKNLRRGKAGANTFPTDKGADLIRSALAIAKASPEDHALGFARREQAPSVGPYPAAFDGGINGLSLDDLAHLVSVMQDEAKRHPNFLIERIDIQTQAVSHSVHTSWGVNQHEVLGALAWDFVGFAKAKADVSGMDYTSGQSRTVKGVEDMLRRDVAAVAHTVLGSLKARKAPRHKGLVILSPAAVWDLVIDPLLFQLSGEAVMDNRSRFEKQLGKKIAAKILTLTDQPHDFDLASASPFDGDGLPTAPLTLVDQGKLIAHCHSLYTARRVGVPPNAMEGGPFALHVAPGTTSLAKLVQLSPQLLYVHRFSGNADPDTGDFSGVAKCSSWYVRGECAYGVKETMISGNFFTLLKNLVAVGDEAPILYGMARVPAMAVEGIAVSSVG